MPDIIETLLLRNLQEVFGEGDPARRRAAIAELYTEDCTVLLAIGRYVGHGRWIRLPANCGPVIRASSTHRIAPRKRFRMGDASRGDPDQPASRLAILGSTSSSSATGRSPPYTSSSTRGPYEVGHCGSMESGHRRVLDNAGADADWQRDLGTANRRGGDRQTSLPRIRWGAPNPIRLNKAAAPGKAFVFRP